MALLTAQAKEARSLLAASLSAEQNAREFDAFMDNEINVRCYDSGLWTREITSTDAESLDFTMQRLTCSFAFECKPIFVDNAYGYEVELPRLIM